MDIKGDWKKRAVSGLMVLAMALSLLPTSILAADTRSVTDNAIKNGSFEQPAFDDRPSPQWVPGPTFDWKTTAFHQKIEFGSSRNGHDAPQLTGNNKDIPDGYQFAELNADEESTLYQYATTVGGNVYEWGLSHRGRYGIDQMAVIIGPKQNVDPAKPSKDGKDQFMQMTDWVKNNAVQMGVSIPRYRLLAEDHGLFQALCEKRRVCKQCRQRAVQQVALQCIHGGMECLDHRHE